jgi:predicted dinucleotide-binding enzyme
MKIGILGAGNVGAALGEAWTRHGHEVYFGVRHPEAANVLNVLKKCGPRARAETPADAVHSSEVVVNALAWPATKSVLESLDLKGKVLLDCTNPLLPDLSGLEVGTTNSGGELVATWAKGARVVKIFNSTGAGNMVNPAYEGKATPILYCGDDAEAKTTAASLARIVGFDPVDAGPLSNSRLLEPLAQLWIWLALKGGMGRDFAFQIVKR